MHTVALTLVLVTGGLFDGGLFGASGNCNACAKTAQTGSSAGRLRQAGYRGGEQKTKGMPQTCYNPLNGCYPGENRHTDRYPAFHGTYYRRPYNYRNLYDYPWHAEQHEPTSMFSYHVPAEEEIKAVEDINARPLPPQELPPEARQRRQPQQERSVVAKYSRLQPIPIDFSPGQSYPRSTRR